MLSELKRLSPTRAKLIISASDEDLKIVKNRVLKKLAADMKIAGFRKGKAPPSLVEKSADQSVLQSQFLDEAMSRLYEQALKASRIRPAGKPEVSVKKFVPFTTLDFEIDVDAVMDLKIADYKKIKLSKLKTEVKPKDIEDVVSSLQTRIAEKKEVSRASKTGDEVTIDFKGVDEKGQPVKGAEGQDYPLMLGSKTFIPGFEEKLVGMKKGDKKPFKVTFPKDYGVKALQSKQVEFKVTVKEVKEVVKPELNDSFASKAGPFKTLKELKDDIKKQLEVERQKEARQKFENDLIEKLIEKSTISIPEGMISHQVEHNLRDLKQNLTYRGQTYEEFLKSEDTTAEKYEKDVLSPQAEKQIKASLVLAEISEREGITVTPEELEVRMQVLKGQYKDAQMQAELNKPEARQDVASRMMSEKVLRKLEEYVSS